jgi:hypothetical protein
MLVPYNCTPSFEGSDLFINTEKGIRFFLKGSEKSVVDFGCICSLVREELDDYALFDFLVHRMINIVSRPGRGNTFFARDPGKIQGIWKRYVSYMDPKIWASRR